MVDTSTHNYRRLIAILQAGKCQNCTFYLRVTYGKAIDVWGDTTSFQNEGEYCSYKKVMDAVSCFHEVEWKS